MARARDLWGIYKQGVNMDVLESASGCNEE